MNKASFFVTERETLSGAPSDVMTNIEAENWERDPYLPEVLSEHLFLNVRIGLYAGTWRYEDNILLRAQNC